VKTSGYATPIVPVEKPFIPTANPNTSFTSLPSADTSINVVPSDEDWAAKKRRYAEKFMAQTG